MIVFLCIPVKESRKLARLRIMMRVRIVINLGIRVGKICLCRRSFRLLGQGWFIAFCFFIYEPITIIAKNAIFFIAILVITILAIAIFIIAIFIIYFYCFIHLLLILSLLYFVISLSFLTNSHLNRVS